MSKSVTASILCNSRQCRIQMPIPYKLHNIEIRYNNEDLVIEGDITNVETRRCLENIKDTGSRTVKELLKKGRAIRYHKEKKEKEKYNELRCTRNTSENYEIKLEQ